MYPNLPLTLGQTECYLPARGRPWEEIDRSLLTATRKGKISGRHQISSRPRSAPTAAGRESGGNDRDRQRQHPEEGRLEQTFDGMEDKKEGVGRSRNRRARWTAGGGREDWCSRGDGGSGGDVGMGPRRQVRDTCDQRTNFSTL